MSLYVTSTAMLVWPEFILLNGLFVYVLKNEVPPNKEKTEEKATKLNQVTTDIPMPVALNGDLIVAKW